MSPRGCAGGFGREAHRPAGNPGRRLVLLTYVQILPSGQEPAASGHERARAGTVPRRPLCPGQGERARRGHLSTVRRHRPRHRGPVDGGRPAQRGPADPAPADPGPSGRRIQRRGACCCGTGRTSGSWRRTRSPRCTSTSRRRRTPGEDAAVIQRGLIGALRLEPARRRDHPAARGRRARARWPAGRQLMEATQANLEPIFLLYDGRRAGRAGRGPRLIEEAAFARTPLAEAVTADGLRHRLWAITDPAELAAIAADLAAARRGHRRRAPPLRRLPGAAGAGAGRRAAGRARGTTVWPCWSTRRAYPPRIGAIHRVIPDLDPEPRPSWPRQRSGCGRCPAARRGCRGRPGELAAASSRGPAFLVAGGDRGLPADRAGSGSSSTRRCRRQRRSAGAGWRRRSCRSC